MTNTSLPMDIEEVLKEGSPGYARCQRLRMQAINAVPKVCPERGQIITRVYRENENLDIYALRAKAMDAVLREMTLFILPDELVVGHMSSMQRSTPLFPEFSTYWIEEEIDTFATRNEDKIVVLPHVRKIIMEEICPYWRNRTFRDRIMSYQTPEVEAYSATSAIFLNAFEEGGLGHVLLDDEKLLRVGLAGIKAEVEEKLSAIPNSNKENLRKEQFYKACISLCDSTIAWANRYAALAADMAKAESDEKRKAELLEISRICNKVPQYPAESFYEAIQSFWVLQMVSQIYDNGVSVTPGRFDQYMYEYYERDILSGSLTKEQAQELLESMWVKFVEPVKLYKEEGVTTNAGYPMGQNLTVSGTTKDGRDATNDLSYRCLEAHSHMLLMQPSFSVRVHNRSPQEFLKRVCEVIRRGSGMPQIVSDEVYIPAMLSKGVSLAEARDYAPVGCIEISPLHTWGRLSGGYVNFAKMIEFALNDGKCRLSGRQVGPNTGDPRNFKTFDEVKEAYRKQVFACLDVNSMWNNRIDMVNDDLMPAPLISILVKDCIENGQDVTSGGARYNWTTPYGVGLANATDSLMVVKKMVFDSKRITMAELVDMLDKNFEGAEDTRQFLMNRVGKYGNDIDEVDEIARFVASTYFDAVEGRECYRGGGTFSPALIPVTAYMPCGRGAGALPDGRKAREPLADGISPGYGRDVKGPTAAIKSINSIDHLRCIGGEIYNQKFSPSSVSSPEGVKKWIELIRSHVALGNGQIQFNIIDEQTLIDAQKNPEKYKGLVVRVAGYSAFFNELSPEVQQTIIDRTRHSF